MESAPVLAATAWADNAAMVLDCARLGYLREEWRTLDPTYGKGNWWTRWHPNELVTHDLAIDGVDFRELPHKDGEFQAAVFDPPYIAQGGRDTSTTQNFLNRFGLVDVPKTTKGVQELINAGLSEVARVTRGFILVKCKDYVNGGVLWLGTHHTLTHALVSGLECVDRLEHLSGTGPQSQQRQVHSRRNFSTLFVFRSRP
jgi:hypothetical protein